LSLLSDISELLQKGKSKEVRELCQKALKQGFPAEEILNEGLIRGMDVVGDKFKRDEVYVPEVLIATRAMKSGIETLEPYLTAGKKETHGTVVIGTVKGDLHDIGKNLVKIMMEGKGLIVIDLGIDVAPEKFISVAEEQNAPLIIACSALLTTTMIEMENLVKAAGEAGIRDRVTIMIGGAPVTDTFCESIGADVYAPDAYSAAHVAVEICSGNRKYAVS